jgi:beta-lactamase class D
VTKIDQVWFFVTNILIDGQKNLPKRKAVTMAVLKKKGII